MKKYVEMNTETDMDMDMEKFLDTVDKEENSSLLNLDNAKIKAIKNDILQKLHFKPEQTKILLKKLKDYRFVDELDDLHYGSYIRWINMKDPYNLKLTNGGVICEIKLSATNSMLITCKNNSNRFFSIKMEECLIFQRLNDNEKLLLSALDYLNK
jgi:hypothetical protein